MLSALRALRPISPRSLGARFFSGHSHGGVPCGGDHGAPYHELDESAKSLKAVLDASPKALVYFTANWCGPCKKIAPHFSELAAQHGGSVQFVKVDVDANQETAEAVR
jgi:thiol-disulfide isomerase/thioredoxin